MSVGMFLCLIRLLGVMVGVCLSAHVVDGDDQTQPPREDVQGPVLRAILDSAITLGFPDIIGSVMYMGPNTIHWSTAQGAREAKFEGLHAKLSTGAWLVGCSLAIQEGHGITLDMSQAKPLDREKLVNRADTAPLESAFGFDWKCRYPSYQGNSGAVCAVALSMGRPHPEEELMCSGGEWEAERLPWTAKPLSIFDKREDPRSEYETAMYTIWPSQLDALNVTHAFRLALACWFRQQLIGLPELFEPMPPDQVAWAALSIAPQLGAGFTEDITYLAGRSHLLQNTPPVPQDLSTRLCSWRIDEALQEDEYRVSISDNLARTKPLAEACDAEWVKEQARERSELDAWQATRFALSDVRELIDVSASTQSSLWMNEGQPRTVGDQAMRAIASIFEIDPRLIVGRKTTAPWTSQERQEVAKGLSARWTRSAKSSCEEMQLALMPNLPADAIGHLLCMTPMGQRRRFFNTLIGMWRTGPPDGLLELVLPFAQTDPAFSKLVDSWPIAGHQRALLAA